MKNTGACPEDLRVADGQSFRLKLIGNLLKALGDPDWEYPESLEDGVPLGVDVELPRSPPPAVPRESEVEPG